MSFPNEVVVQIFEPSTPFGGVQIQGDNQPITNIELDSGSPVQSVFGRVGDIQAKCSDYALCYAPLGAGLPAGGAPGQVLSKNSGADYDAVWSAAGSGSVTNFSAGALSPLFTTAVANPGTTPALSFSLSDAGAHQFLGNNTGAPGAPAYVQPAFSDLSGQFALNQTPSTTAGVLIGRGAGAGAGIFQEIILGTNLSMSGTTLNASGGSGNVIASGSPTLDQTAVWVDGTHIKGVTTLKGGSANQVLTKNSVTDFDWGWVTPAAGGNVSTSGVITTGQLAEWVTGTTIRSDTPAQARTAIGATTLGGNLITLPNVAAISYLRINADNSLTTENAATFLSDIGGAAKGAIGSSGLTMNTARLLGRTTAGVGAPEEVSVAAELSLSALSLGIATAGVTYAKIQNVAALSVFGRASNSSGVGADITAGADFNVLRRSGTSIGFGAIDVSQAGAVTGRLAYANLTQGTARSVLGVTGNAGADWAAIQGTADQVLVVNGAGTALAFGTVATNGLTNAAVTYAKIQNVAAESVLCRANSVSGAVGEVALAASQLFGRGATGDLAAITLGTNLSMTGTTLNATGGGGGNVSNSGTPVADQLPIWVDATHIKGVTGLTGGLLGQVLKKNSGTDYDWSWGSVSAAAGGSDKQIQFNDGGTTLNGDAAHTFDKATGTVGFKNGLTIGSGPGTSGWIDMPTSGPSGLGSGGSGTNPWIAYAAALGNYFGDAGPGDICYRAAVGNKQLIGNAANANATIAVLPNEVAFTSAGLLAWSSTTATNGTVDISLGRNAAGVVEVNNGTAGQYRDLLARGLRSNAVLFANRIASPVEGTFQAFTDSSTNSQGATITGGGTNHVVGYYNGTNWIVATGAGAGGGNVTTSATLTSNALILGNGGVDLKVSAALSSDGNGQLILGDQSTISGSIKLLTGTVNALTLNPPSLGANASFTFPIGTTNLSATGGAGHVLKQATLGGAITSGTLAASDVGLGNVTNDAQVKASDFPAPSVDGEIALFSGTTGKSLKRATGTGLVTATAGVYGTVTAPSGAVVGTTDTQTLSGKRVNPRVTDQNAPSTPYTPDSDANDMVILRGIANATQTINAPSGTPVQGQKLILRLKDNGTSRTLAFQTGSAGQYRFSTDMAAPAATVINATLYMAFIYNSTDSRWDNVAQMNNF